MSNLAPFRPTAAGSLQIARKRRDDARTGPGERTDESKHGGGVVYHSTSRADWQEASREGVRRSIPTDRVHNVFDSPWGAIPYYHHHHHIHRPPRNVTSRDRTWRRAPPCALPASWRQHTYSRRRTGRMKTGRTMGDGLVVCPPPPRRA